MAQQITIKASEGHRTFGKLLKRIYNSDEHLIVERDGFPIAVMMSYQEYQQLSQLHNEVTPPENLSSVMNLEQAFGSVTPLNQPEDFAALREAAIEDHVERNINQQNQG